MKILSWNILHGGGSRINDIVATISAHDADLVCLQEFRHGASKLPLLEGLRQAGWIHQFTPQPASNRKNTVAIVSRIAFEPDQSTLVFTEQDNTARCIKVQIAQGPERINVITASLPHKKAQLPVFETLLALPEHYRQQHSIMIGDFNCGIPFEDSQTKSFYATHLFQALLKQGWTDAWRSRHPKAREFSWFSTQKGNGFRYDHALCSAPMDKTIKRVWYDHAAREQRISDHSIVLLEA